MSSKIKFETSSMNKLKKSFSQNMRFTDELKLELSSKATLPEVNFESIESELAKRRQQVQERASELQDSEELMKKIVKSFLANTDDLSRKFQDDLDRVSSLDLKLLKIQSRLQDILAANAFYSKELRRLKVG